MRPHQRFGGRTLHEGARLVVDLRAQEVIGCRIADLELDRRIERHQLGEIGLSKIPRLRGRHRGDRLGPQLGDRPKGRDAELIRSGLRLDVAPRESHTGRIRLRRSPRPITREHDPLAVVQPVGGKRKRVPTDFGEWIRKEPLDERPETTVSLVDIQNVVVRSVLADQALQGRRRGRRHSMIDPHKRVTEGLASAQPCGGVRVRQKAAAGAKHAVVDDERVTASAELRNAATACRHDGETATPMCQLDLAAGIRARRVSPDE